MRFTKLVSDLLEMNSVETFPDGSIRHENDVKISYKNKNGELHRLDGPAWVYKTGSHAVEYWVDGRPHRTDGPAFRYDGGRERYFVNGKELTKEEFLKHFGDE